MEKEFREGVRARDPACWARLFDSYWEPLYRQVRVLLPVRLDSENALGEVWLRALKAASRYDTRRPPFPWLARICVNVCLNVRRHERRLRFLSFEPESAPPAARGLGGADRDELRRALRALPRRQAEVLALRFVFGVATNDVAELLDLEVSSVKKHLLRGVQSLREIHGAPLRAFELDPSDRKSAS